MKRYIPVILILLCSLLAVSVLAYPIPDGAVYDGSLFLDEETKNAITEASDAFYESRGIRIAVCTVDTVGEESMKDFASGVFTEWNPGNAVLILIDRQSRSYYGVQNNDLAEHLDSEKILEILDANLKGAFETDEGHAEGILATVRSFVSYLTEKVPADFGGEKTGGMPKALSVILKIVVVIVLLLAAGYITLLVLEKRQAEKKRAYLEERRRRMARDGRGAYRPTGYNDPYRAYGTRRPPAQGRAPQRGGAPRGNVPRQGNTGGAPMSRSGYGERLQGRSTNGVRQTRPDGFDRRSNTTDTVQINTADLRAAMRSRRGD